MFNSCNHEWPLKLGTTADSKSAVVLKVVLKQGLHNYSTMANI